MEIKGSASLTLKLSTRKKTGEKFETWACLGDDMEAEKKLVVNKVNKNFEAIHDVAPCIVVINKSHHQVAHTAADSIRCRC